VLHLGHPPSLPPAACTAAACTAALPTHKTCPHVTSNKPTSCSLTHSITPTQSFTALPAPADFAEVRSKSDAALLYDAKYGELEGGKMSKEQYQALRRRVGGTAKDYFKSW
jgi:hypothetical protein